MKQLSEKSDVRMSKDNFCIFLDFFFFLSVDLMTNKICFKIPQKPQSYKLS